jgi:hypothetical protein
MSKNGWFLICVPLLFPLTECASPLTQLTMSSDPTDYIGQGQDYFFDLANTTSFTVVTFDYNGDGQPNTIDVNISTAGGDWQLLFGTNNSNMDLTAGYYPDATDAGTPGDPFMDVSGDGRGSSVTGEFTVLYSSFPTVTQGALAPPGSSFAITFVQSCCGYPPNAPEQNGNLYGTLYYNYNPVATPEPRFGALAGCSVVTLLLGRRFLCERINVRRST